MKAIVKATHEVVEINSYDTDKKGNLYYYTEDYHKYHESELELLFIKDYDYWEKLKHQYAGMAMQGILSNGEYLRSLMHTKHDDFRADEVVPSIAVRLSHALVEKMKEERK